MPQGIKEPWLLALGQSITPEEAMALALKTAQQGLGFTSPNPLVGCVIVDKDHGFLSQGAHLGYGQAHAEINALKGVKDPLLLKGATLYVTLEPCSHQGQTPPCSQAIIKTPIQKVVYGVKDPYREGLSELQKAGKQVEPFSPLEAQKARKMNQAFFHHMEHKKPFIALKVAASLDGKIALKTGESQWITDQKARLHGRLLRGHYDATLIGAGTFLQDKPRLDFRGTFFESKKQNKIVLLDPKGQAIEEITDSKLFNIHGGDQLFILTTQDFIPKWSQKPVHVIPWEPTKEGWEKALKSLYEKGIYSLYGEGGRFVFGQLLSFALAQKLHIFQSPKILGEGLSWSEAFKNESIKQVPRLKDWEFTALGETQLITGYL